MAHRSFDYGRSAWWLSIALAGIAVLASCASTVVIGDAPASIEESVAETDPLPTALPDSSVVAPAQTIQCRSDASFRARLVETDPAADEVLTEFRYEVTAEYVQEELAGAGRGQVILQGTEAWSFSQSGWIELPVRPLRTPWVNNFVTCEEVARAAQDVEPDRLYGLDVQSVELNFEQFSEAFSDKIGDTGCDADATSLTFCNVSLQKDVNTVDQIVRFG